jgi:bis(5'-nucleosyl)-tetraphosphatase (symmetrical)
MASYAIGDLQGCFDEFQGLLELIEFNPRRDQLWLAGDLVNRGPKSLETLRFARTHNLLSVLGNHDLHLLASACLPAHRKRKDTLAAILDAPDSEELLYWLRHRPLLHHDSDSGFTLLHAGLPPQWDLGKAQSCAREVEQVLRSDHYQDFFEQMYGNQPHRWREDLSGWDRLRFITNCFTRLRYCDSKGCLALDEKGPPGSQPKHLKPWFAWPQRRSRDMQILFGHWSTLGAYSADGVHALDTGCLWGGKLTALRIDVDPPLRIEYNCPGACKPGL